MQKRAGRSRISSAASPIFIEGISITNDILMGAESCRSPNLKPSFFIDPPLLLRGDGVQEDSKSKNKH